MTRSHFTLFALVAMMLTLSAACAPEGDAQDGPDTSNASELTHETQDTAPIEATVLNPELEAQVAVLGADCEVPGMPVLETLTAYWNEEHNGVDFQLEGRHCGAEIGGFGFEILNHEDIDVSGRSWPELHSVETLEDGRFIMRGEAATCSGYIEAERVSIFMPIGSWDNRTDSLEAPIADHNADF